jgi:hypothetical protein
MKSMFASALLVLSLCAAPAFAEAPIAQPAVAEKANAQTSKMKSCAEEYKQKNLAKNEYRKFMSVCLRKDYQMGSYISGKPVAAVAPAAKPMAPTVAAPAVPAAAVAAPVAAAGIAVPAVEAKVSQREKMKTCNASAKEKALKGDERKTFMKECLSAN